MTVYPCGFARPVASNVNFLRGVDVANQVTAKIGTDGHVCFFTSTETQLVADLSGWYADDFAAVPGFGYHELDPARIVDTRDGTGLGGRAPADSLRVRSSPSPSPATGACPPMPTCGRPR